VVKKITVPVLVTHNRMDRIVPAAMSDYILRQCKTASASWYPGETHAPFFEAAVRFNTELINFAGTLAAPP
jgi:pimeloyl-ACP methyl ester carboxylesterase